jgi:RHS repeat-associated protein
VGKLGYYFEADLNTYWLRARVYDPQRGRFISRDPVREEANLYRWPGNSPVGTVDPTGARKERDYRCPPPQDSWACRVKQPGAGLWVVSNWKVARQKEKVSCQCRGEKTKCEVDIDLTLERLHTETRGRRTVNVTQTKHLHRTPRGKCVPTDPIGAERPNRPVSPRRPPGAPRRRPGPRGKPFPGFPGCNSFLSVIAGELSDTNLDAAVQECCNDIVGSVTGPVQIGGYPFGIPGNVSQDACMERLHDIADNAMGRRGPRRGHH